MNNMMSMPAMPTTPDREPTDSEKITAILSSSDINLRFISQTLSEGILTVEMAIGDKVSGDLLHGDTSNHDQIVLKIKDAAKEEGITISEIKFIPPQSEADLAGR